MPGRGRYRSKVGSYLYAIEQMRRRLLRSPAELRRAGGIVSLNILPIENDFRHAIERQEFALYYQPKVNLKSGAIAGVEALIRWRHPQRGLLEPGAVSGQARRAALSRSRVVPAACRVCRQTPHCS